MPAYGPHIRDRARNDPLVAYFACFALLGVVFNLLGPGLPALRRQMHASIGSIGVVFGALAVGYFVGTAASGRAYDRGHGHRLLVGALLALVPLIGTVPFVTRRAELALVMALVGVAGGIVEIGCNTLLMWSRGTTVARAMNTLHLAFGVGALITPVLVQVSVSASGGVGAACGALAGAAVIGAVLVGRSPTPEAPTVPRALEAPTASGHGVPTGVESDATHTRRSAAATVVADETPAPRRPLGLLTALAVFFFLYVGLELGFADWITTYVEAAHIGGSGVAAGVTTAFWVAFTVGRAGAVAVVRRLGPARLLAGSGLLATAAAVLLVLAGSRPAGVWTASALLGLGAAPQFPTMLAYARDHLHLDGRSLSHALAGSAVAGLVIPWLIGDLVADAGAGAMPTIVLGLAAGTVAWFAILSRLLSRGGVEPAPRKGIGRVPRPGPAGG